MGMTPDIYSSSLVDFGDDLDMRMPSLFGGAVEADVGSTPGIYTDPLGFGDDFDMHNMLSLFGSTANDIPLMNEETTTRSLIHPIKEMICDAQPQGFCACLDLDDPTYTY